MNKEKLISLVKYESDVKLKLASTVLPEKHKNRAKEYRQFLERELSMVSAKIELVKTAMPVEVKK